tara:strand:- start:146 stop:667 length:522 start_codon:yes stop_codon:yes gene_type:complete
MQKIIKFFIILPIIFVLGIFYLSLNKNPSYDTKFIVGNKISDIKLQSFYKNKVFTEENFKKNNYTLINFWASWCAPCRTEHPFLIELTKEKNLKILGVNFKDKKINAIKFLQDLGNPYDYLVKDSLGKQSVIFGIYGIPESILVDSEFKVLKKFIGPINFENYEDIKKIINTL